MASGTDLDRLRRALALAAKGRFAVEPNPIVGCVLVRDGGVVGEGWHAAYGGPHAEAAALALAGEAARGATAYVSLEPCTADRPGKKTPPCADALVRAGVTRVVYAAADPTLGGAGAAHLRAAGVAVEGPCLSEEGDALLRPFRRAETSGRPWVHLKWAMSWDGRISPARGLGGRITGSRALALAHEMRGRAEAVAIGVETLLTDDPLLTCRLPQGPPDGRPQPLRVVFDSALRTPLESRLLSEGGGPVLVVCAGAPPPQVHALERVGAEVWQVPGGEGRVDLATALARLRTERGVRRLLVEGGARLHGSLLREGLADQVSAFLAPRILGAHGAPAAVDGTGFADLETAPRLEHASWRGLGEDLLLQGYVPAGKP